MSTLILYAADVVAATVLAVGIYWPRHRRRDLVVAFLGINVGVLAVAALLAGSSVTAGLGLGLFGVLSIIRLRSDELAQHEIAYYFAVLALGLVGGLASTTAPWLALTFMALIVTTMAVVDSPAFLSGHRRQVLVVDRTFHDESLLRQHLAQLLSADVRAATVIRTDLINDSTTVDVRYQVARRDVVRAEGQALA